MLLLVALGFSVNIILPFLPNLLHALFRHHAHCFFALSRKFCILARSQSLGRHSSIHLWEQETEDSLPVFPFQVVQVHLILHQFLSIFTFTNTACSRTRRSRIFLHAAILSSHCWISETSLGPLLSFFKRILLPYFFFDLLKSLQKELFNFAALIQNYLRNGAHISKFRVLNPQVFSRINDFVPLLLDDSFVLISHQLFFFFEVAHDLLETAFENLDFFLIILDLAGLKVGPLRILLLRSLIYRDVSLNFSIQFFLRLNFSLVLFELVSLRDRFQRQRLIFFMNVLFNGLDASVCRSLSFCFELLKLLCILVLNFFFILSQSDLNLVLCLCDLLLLFVTVLLPLDERRLSNDFLLGDVLHGEHIFA